MNNLRQALDLAQGGRPRREARALFPTDPEEFFVEGEPAAVEIPDFPVITGRERT